MCTHTGTTWNEPRGALSIPELPLLMSHPASGSSDRTTAAAAMRHPASPGYGMTDPSYVGQQDGRSTSSTHIARYFAFLGNCEGILKCGNEWSFQHHPRTTHAPPTHHPHMHCLHDLHQEWSYFPEMSGITCITQLLQQATISFLLPPTYISHSPQHITLI